MDNLVIPIIKMNAWSYVNLDGLPQIADCVIKACSYTDPTHKFKSAWARRQSTGVISIIETVPDQPNAYYMRFPTGLLRIVTDAIHNCGYRVEMTDEGVLTERGAKYRTNPEVQIREYQRQVVQEAVSHERGVICCPTGSGKTLMAGLIIAELGYEHVVFLVHRKELLDQTVKLFRWLFPDEKIGIIGCGMCDIQRITVAMIQTIHMALNDPNIQEYGLTYDDDDADLVSGRRSQIVEAIANADLVIEDECHGVKSRTVFGSIMAFPIPSRVYGMSATPNDKDGTDILLWAVFDKVIAHIKPKTLIDAGWLLMPVIRYISFDCTGMKIKIKCTDKKCGHTNELDANYTPGIDGMYTCGKCKHRRRFSYGHVQSSLIDNNDALHQRLAQEINTEIDANRIVAVSISHISLGESLLKYIPGAVLLTSQDTKERREKVFNKLRKKDLKCVVTTLISEGVDVPALDTIVIMDGKDDGLYKQRIGRVMRRDPNNPDKKMGHVIDVWYKNATFLSKHSETRYKCANREHYVTIIT